MNAGRLWKFLLNDPMVEPLADEVAFEVQRRRANHLAKTNPQAQRELNELAKRAETTWIHDEEGSRLYLEAERKILDKYRRTQ